MNYPYRNQNPPVNAVGLRLLADLGITASYRIEAISERRNRILVELDDHTLVVSFAAKVPSRRTAVISKLRHALKELAEVA